MSATPGDPDHDWRAAVIDAIRARNAGQLAGAPAARPLEVEGVIGLLGARCFIYVDELLEPAERLVGRLESADPASFVLIAGALGTDLDESLMAGGWSFRRTLEMMVLTAHGAAAPKPAEVGVTIEALTETNLAQAQRLTDAAFGFHADVSGLVGTAGARGLLARDRSGQVISMGAWLAAGEGARIVNIVTDHEHRGRGLGGLMTLQAVDGAQRAGARFSYLEATPDGAGVYRRVGFRTLDSWRVFHRPPRDG